MFQDILEFMRTFIEGQSLLRCSQYSGLSYKNTSVDWANFIRDLFRIYVFEQIIESQDKLSGIVEIDESLFGRKCKYQRGNRSGVKVWIFGLLERSTNRLLLFPVDDRTEERLVSIINNYVEKGSTIYSDGWGAYANLKWPRLRSLYCNPQIPVQATL